MSRFDWRKHRLTGSLLALVLGACSVSPSPSAPSSPSGGATPLPSYVAAAPGCAGLPLDHFTVHMDASDPWLVWFDIEVLGRVDVYWPSGYGVRFEPEAVVVSSSGTVLFHDGQFVSDSYGVCVIGPGGRVSRVSWRDDQAD